MREIEKGKKSFIIMFSRLKAYQHRGFDDLRELQQQMNENSNNKERIVMNNDKMTKKLIVIKKIQISTRIMMMIYLVKWIKMTS